MITTMRGIGLAGLLGLISVLCVSGCSETQINYPDRQMPAGLMSDQNQLEAGKTLFLSKCAHCHGKPSEGRSDRAAFFEPPAPDFTDKHFQEMDPAYLYWRIDVGKTVEPYRSQGSVMPAWGIHLSETQIWQLVAYIRSRAH